MTDAKQEKLKRFMADQVMNEAVKDVLLSHFLKQREKHDVNSLAAERLAIILLQDAWRTLENFEPEVEQQKPERVRGF